LNPLVVKFVQSEGCENENKLFIGMLPKSVDETDLEAMFCSYGELREIHVIRSPDGVSKGCAFVKFQHRDAAIVSIDVLNNSISLVINY
jgi:CUG-BP- and ETR3-like factor